MGGLKKTSLLVFFASAALFVGGCTGTSPDDSQAPLTATSLTSTPPRTISAPPSGTNSVGSSAPASAGEENPATGSENEPTVLPTQASVTVFYIAVGDGGTSGPAVGCGDSAVAVTSATITYTDPVEGALRTLLANHAQEIGQSGLSNALWRSELAVASVERSGASITAHLNGTLSIGGECDNPRIEQQLLLTAQQAAGAPVTITINGKTLSEALSLK